MSCAARRLNAAADEAELGAYVDETIMAPPATRVVAGAPTSCAARRLTAAADEAGAGASVDSTVEKAPAAKVPAGAPMR